jgi:hypothetical protein
MRAGSEPPRRPLGMAGRGIVVAMGLKEIAKKLADPTRIGLDPELAKRLGVDSEEVVRGRLLAESEEGRSHLGVHWLATYVIDDTDFWGDGEIYWWTIPAMVDEAGNVTKSALHGLPTGASPHKTGSLEWMTNFSLADPPLVAVIPPAADVASCVIRFGVYDDDRKPADVPKAIAAGLAAYADLSAEPLHGAENIITPVREAIFKSLVAEQDDILIDQDVVIRRGDAVRFGAGMIGSVVNSMARIYYVVRDEERTKQFGPVMLHKGQSETVQFDTPMKRGGRLAVFARGADVTCASFGDLSTDMPFQNRVVEARQEAALAQGFTVTGTGPAKLIAFYTPP